jgi:hypothetical protein
MCTPALPHLVDVGGYLFLMEGCSAACRRCLPQQCQWRRPVARTVDAGIGVGIGIGHRRKDAYEVSGQHAGGSLAGVFWTGNAIRRDNGAALSYAR